MSPAWRTARTRCIRRGLVALPLLLVLAARVAAAHTFAPALLDLHERTAGVFDVHWRLPPEGTALGMEAEGVMPQLPSRCRWLQPLRLDADAPADGRLDCGAGGLSGTTLAVAGLSGSRLDVIVRVTWRDGQVTTAALRSDAAAFVVPAHGAGNGRGGVAVRTVVSSYVRLGIDHILTGYDHLLFVLGLILLVETWGALLQTISAFTVAHSVTLALAVLGVVQVPPAPVEALIALSILLLAVELTRASAEPQTLARRYPWLVAFAFGLLHGLGFAGALAQTGLPAQQIVVALVAFNVGVEIGQLMFVTVMLAPVRLLQRMPWAIARRAPAYAIGAVAAAWVLQRVAGFGA